MVWQKSIVAVVFFIVVFLAIYYLPIGEEWIGVWSKFIGFFRNRNQDENGPDGPDSVSYNLDPGSGIKAE